MNIDINAGPFGLCAYLSGRLSEKDGEQIKYLIQHLHTQGRSSVTLNCAKLRAIDMAGFGLLKVFAEVAHHNHIKVVMTGLNTPLSKMVQLLSIRGIKNQEEQWEEAPHSADILPFRAAR